jgi:chemotaxis protein methyltransferase CheR
LKRRVRAALNDEGLTSIDALEQLLLGDPAAMVRFVATVSVHVSSFFRDAAFFRALRDVVLPMLRTYPFLRIWHVGCATGEEVYSVAILLEEAGLYPRCRIYATDMSDTVVQQARSGIFPTSRILEAEQSYRASGGSLDFGQYFVNDGERGMFRSSLRSNLVFAQHNLVCDGMFNDFHLILCRNVMLYFNAALRQRVLHLLDRSLVPLGVLGLGMKESLAFTAQGPHYEELAPDCRLYQRRR